MNRRPQLDRSVQARLLRQMAFPSAILGFITFVLWEIRTISMMRLISCRQEQSAVFWGRQCLLVAILRRLPLSWTPSLGREPQGLLSQWPTVSAPCSLHCALSRVVWVPFRVWGGRGWRRGRRFARPETSGALTQMRWMRLTKPDLSRLEWKPLLCGVDTWVVIDRRHLKECRFFFSFLFFLLFQ